MIQGIINDISVRSTIKEYTLVALLITRYCGTRHKLASFNSDNTFT